MAGELREYSGWWAPNPFYLKEPEKETDLVIPLREKATYEMPDLYTSEAEAWQAMKRYLTEGLEQARRNLDLLPKLIGCPASMTAEWQEKERTHQKCAERGLQLCRDKMKQLGQP